jgi:hypothetical protein
MKTHGWRANSTGMGLPKKEISQEANRFLPLLFADTACACWKVGGNLCQRKRFMAARGGKGDSTIYRANTTHQRKRAGRLHDQLRDDRSMRPDIPAFDKCLR